MDVNTINDMEYAEAERPQQESIFNKAGADQAEHNLDNA
jgi:hypothetical protein